MTGMGIYIALSGMRAQQQNIDVTGQNIANASTPGYTRQRTVMEADTPWPVPAPNMPGGPGQFGTGVVVKTVERIRDQFLDQQIREQTLAQGQWQQRSDALSQVETTFMELSDTGLNAVLGKFWDAWAQLGKFPDSAPVRTTLAETATTLADTIRNTYSRLSTLQQDLNQEIALKVDHVNDLLTQIADMNQQIKTITVSGLSPNDLLDRRDLLLDNLSQTVSADITVHPDNSLSVTIGGMQVVQGSTTVNIKAVPDANGSNYAKLQLGDDSNSTISLDQVGGELQGLFEARENDVQGYIDRLDELARGLAEAINNQHMKGYGLEGETGVPFFVGSDQEITSTTEPHQVTTAGSIFVNPYITENPGRIAAAATVGDDGKVKEGDNGNALLLSQLENTPVDFKDKNGNKVATDTINNFYKSTISKLGVDTGHAKNMVTNQQALVDQLNNRKESISGVSLDEEMANMVIYQNAYRAAAKLINVIDDMMQTVINMGGR